jgi:hypothetical protein
MSISVFKSAFTLLFLCTTCLVLSSQPNSNYTGIRNTNMQIKASLNNSPLAWATEKVNLTLNKQTGEFEAKLLVDDLQFATPNDNFTGATGENKGKYLTLTGTLPVNDVLENANNAIDRKVEMTTHFNDNDYQSEFNFTILALQTGGFSVMANGTISISALGISNLSELDDELVIILSFTGF